MSCRGGWPASELAPEFQQGKNTMADVGTFGSTGPSGKKKGAVKDGSSINEDGESRFRGYGGARMLESEWSEISCFF